MAKKIYRKGSGKPGYPSDVTDEEWAFCAPYLTLMTEDAPQREHALRDVFNALRYLVRYGCSWRALPNDLPPWYTVHQQTQRWIAADVFTAMANDLRRLLRLFSDRDDRPSAVILDGRTLLAKFKKRREIMSKSLMSTKGIQETGPQKRPKLKASS